MFDFRKEAIYEVLMLHLLSFKKLLHPFVTLLGHLIFLGFMLNAEYKT